MANMKCLRFKITVLVALAVFLFVSAQAEIVYKQVNVIVDGHHYWFDLNGDGIYDFDLGSWLNSGVCWTNPGTESSWSAYVNMTTGNGVVTTSGEFGPYAVALPQGAPIDSHQSFGGDGLLTLLEWGDCGTGSFGEWLNLPNRYLGFQLLDARRNVHYAWAQVGTFAYIDQQGGLRSTVFLSGFAWETIPGQGILAGQTSGEY